MVQQKPRAVGGVFLALVATVLLATISCRHTTPQPDDRYTRALPDGAYALTRVTDPRELPNLRYLAPIDADLIGALDQSISYFQKPSSQQHFPYELPDRTITHEVQVESLAALRSALLRVQSPDELRRIIERDFDVYRSVGWDGVRGDVLFTAYYTPILRGSLRRHGPYQYPLYRRPPDLVATEDGQPLGRRTANRDVVPYYTRAEIERGDLLAGHELVYLDDPFDAFLVHVQGSASILLDEGAELHVGYAGKTDRPYQSIGQELVRTGKIRAEEISLTKIRDYLARNPRELRTTLHKNPCFVFFQEGEPGPFGSIGVRVTPRHTIATDKSVFPRGGPVIVATSLPEPGHEQRARPHVGVYFDQDTGGAIRSAGRADLYLGRGADAERLAGHTRHEGRLYYLFLKESGTP